MIFNRLELMSKLEMVYCFLCVSILHLNAKFCLHSQQYIFYLLVNHQSLSSI